MGYDRGDSFHLDFEPNGNPFGSKSKGKLSPRSYLIQCERKWKHSFLSLCRYATCVSLEADISVERFLLFHFPRIIIKNKIQVKK